MYALLLWTLVIEKFIQHNEIRTWSVSHGDWFTCQKSAQYLEAFRKKVGKTVRLVKFPKSKARNFAKILWSKTKLKLDL